MLLKPAVFVIVLASVAKTLATPLAFRHATRGDKGFTVNEKGNFHVGFSDDRINIGTIHPQEVMRSLRDHCSTAGTCEDSWEVDTLLPAKAKLRVSIPEAQYGADIMGGLIAELVCIAGSQEVFKRKMKETEQFSSCSGVASLSQSFCGSASEGDTIRTNLYYFPKTMFVSYKPEGVDVPPLIKVSLELKDGDDGAMGGLCSAMTTLGSALLVSTSP